ncbi:MAG: hypothetical protein AAFV98_05885 [Chloroflexota bacterium]
MFPFKLHRNTRTAWSLIVVTLLLAGGVVTTMHYAGAFTSAPEARIAYAGFDGNDYEVFTVNPDGSDLVQVTNNDVDDWGATWSPDHSQLAFRSMRTGNSAIYTMNADGTDIERITPDYLYVGSPTYQATLTWSPDGTHIAYSANHSGNWDIYKSAVNYRAHERLTSHPANDLHPDWSVNDEIIFNSDREGRLEIFTIDADGTNLQREWAHTGEAFTIMVPRWSPDGTSYLVFKNYDTVEADIFLINSNGEMSQLTIGAGIDRVPTFSPDGTHIVFRSERDGDSDIYTMNLRTGDVLPLTNDNNTNMSPDW